MQGGKNQILPKEMQTGSKGSNGGIAAMDLVEIYHIDSHISFDKKLVFTLQIRDHFSVNLDSTIGLSIIRALTQENFWTIEC